MGSKEVDNAAKLKMATEATKAMFTMMATLSNEVQLEAATMLLLTMFNTCIKPEYRLSMFSSVVHHMRDEIKKNLKTGVKA